MKKTSPERAVGVDVSAKELHVSTDDGSDVRVFKNNDAGHKELVSHITQGRRQARVVIEATGTYHLRAIAKSWWRLDASMAKLVSRYRMSRVRGNVDGSWCT